MGLDVNLKYSPNRVAALESQSKAEKMVDALWANTKGYEKSSVEEREQIRKATEAIYQQLGLDEWGSSENIEHIEEDSVRHPKHMFKVGSLRSSYNQSGINSVLGRIGCLDLYDIFDVQRDDGYYITPDWQQSLTRVNDAIAQMNEYMVSDMAKYDATLVTVFDQRRGCDSAQEALGRFKEETSRGSSLGGIYSNANGYWMMDGRRVVGVVPNSGFGGGVYLITESETAGDSLDLAWYLAALEVTQEMIIHVLTKPDPENYFLSWSA